MKKKLSLVLATLMLLGLLAGCGGLLQAATRIRWWCISAISSTP